FSALQDPLLKFAIQRFQLLCLAMEIGKHSYFRAEKFGNHRDRNVVDGAVLVSLELIEIGEMYCRHEDDRGPLETWMLANHGRQLKTVELWHADVHQHHRDFPLQKNFERLFGRVG